jgi:DNA replication protein DnaC
MPVRDEQHDDLIVTIDANKYWRDSGVPERHKGKTLLRHEAQGPWGETYRRLRDRLPRGPLIVLLGPRGTGKTQLAACLLADVCRTGKEIKYLKMMDLFRNIRACYGPNPDRPDEVKTVNRLCNYAALVLDEAHERSDSDWENSTLNNIIDRRYDAMRTTILVSNMTKEAFAQAVGASIVSRIHESGVVEVCNWRSFREQSPEKN